MPRDSIWSRREFSFVYKRREKTSATLTKRFNMRTTAITLDRWTRTGCATLTYEGMVIANPRDYENYQIRKVFDTNWNIGQTH